MPKQGEIQLVISAVSDQAKKELGLLSKQYEKLKTEQEALTQGTEAYAKKASEVDKVRQKMEALAQQIESGNISTLDRLSKAEKAAERELKGLTEGTEEYIKVAKRLESVRAEKSQLKDKIAEIGKEMEKTGSGFKNFAGGMKESLTSLAPLGAAAVGAFAADKLLEFGKGAVEAFNEAENAAFQMHNAFVTLGGESEETFQRLMDQADLLEQTTFGFTAEQIQGAQKQLKLFGLTGEEIEKLTPKILDYATATGKELGGATDDVTNALLGKTKALEQVGIHLKESEKTVQGVTNSLDKFGGSASAALEVGTNKTERFWDMWGKVEEAVGGFLVGAGEQLLEWLTPIGEALAGYWAVLTQIYSAIQSVVARVIDWVDSMSNAYPLIGKIVEGLKQMANPFAAIGFALKAVVGLFQSMGAGAIAGAKTIRDVWGELATYAGDIWGNIGGLIGKVFSGDFGGVSEAWAKLKNSVGTAATDIGSTFVANYNAQMAKFTLIPEATADPVRNIKDRKIKTGGDKDEEIKAKQESADELKKLREKEQKEIEDEEKKRKQQEEKDTQERAKFREEYYKRLLEGNKLIQAQTIDLMSEGLEKEKAILIQKKEEQLATISQYEQEVINNTAITEAERTALLNTYADARKNIEAGYLIEVALLEEQHKQAQIQAQNDELIRQAEQQEELLSLKNKSLLAHKDLEIMMATGNAEQILALSKERLDLEKQMLLDNVELSLSERELIEAQYRDKKSDLDRKAAEDKKAMDKEVSDAMIGLLQEGLSALSQFSQISTDKSISEAEKLKDARIKKLDEEKKKGKVSEEKFAKDKEAIELQANRKIAALKTEQAKKDKALAVVQSLINTAVAVTASLAQPPGVPVTIPFGVAAGVAGALQTSLIIAKPIPEFRDGGSFIRGVSPRYNIGGIPSGPSHSQGGIKMVDSSTGETVGELEGGEMYHIYSKETVKNNRPIMDRLLYSSLHRNGAPIFSAGGVIASAPVTAIPESTRAVATSTTLIDLGPLLDKIAVLTDEIRNKTDRLEAYITYASIENSFDEVSNIKKIAGRD